MVNVRLHSSRHLIKSMLGNAEFLLGSSRRDLPELFVVNYHGTQKKFLGNFRNQLDFFCGKYNLIGPEQLADFYAGKLKNLEKPYLLISFDDGIKNNLSAAD